MKTQTAAQIAASKYRALFQAAERVRSVLNDEGKEILTKSEMEQILFDAMSQIDDEVVS